MLQSLTASIVEDIHVGNSLYIISIEPSKLYIGYHY